MKLPPKSKDACFGIVIDSGSSGSRIHVYQWEDPKVTRTKTDDAKLLKSPPRIISKKEWTKKISPGISTFQGSKVKTLWTDHLSKLMTFAEEIVPSSHRESTPVFVLSTAGMRLLEPSQRNKILEETLVELRTKTNFYVSKDFVQTIPGSMEGVYGWLGLNYLLGSLDNYDLSSENESIGFMDMGGASTQIAFVPSSRDEIEKHLDDLATITLLNIDGTFQNWNVFVETWLGFGANEARKRYLSSLNGLSHSNDGEPPQMSDPCLPKGAEISYDLGGLVANVKGSGRYDICLKTIYPLLMKNIECHEDPCLFNGVHAPKLNFEKDKFIGISEFWYTANDIFQSGGEYNFHSFNEKVRDYCESDWSTILENSKQGKYSNLDPNRFLTDACFKASWVINILHEGFGLPRLGLEVDDAQQTEGETLKSLERVHIPFKSADSVNNEELSWTLGRILLYASSGIDPKERDQPSVGFQPSAISKQSFVPGGRGSESVLSSDGSGELEFSGTFFPVLSIILIIIFFYQVMRGNVNKWLHKDEYPNSFGQFYRRILKFGSNLPILNHFTNNATIYPYQINMEAERLEEGMTSTSSNNATRPGGFVLRTRSNLSLVESSPTQSEHDSRSQRKSPDNMFNRPFVVPKRASSNVYPSLSNDPSGKDAQVRLSSNSSFHITAGQG